jgi:dGTPase
MAPILKEQFNKEKANKIVGITEKLGVLRAMTINKLAEECTTLFLDHEENILEGNFDQALTDSIPSKDSLRAISKISMEKIYRARTVVEIEASGHAVLPGLLEEFVTAGQSLQGLSASRKYENLQLMLPEEIRWELSQHTEHTYSMLRLIVDFVSGLTDRHALSLFRKLKGFSI